GKVASRAGVTGTVGMRGMAMSGMFPLLVASLAVLRCGVIRGGAAQAVVDGKAQSRLRNGHDRNAVDAPLIERAQHGKKVGRRFAEIARGAEIAGQPGTLGYVGAESEQALVRLDRRRLPAQGSAERVVAREPAPRP